MRVEMTFDPAAVPEGYRIGDVYHTITGEFAKYGLRCCSDGEVLAFEDNGCEDDYAYMWNAVISLLKSKWFVDCATSCSFFDDDESEEDVLAQAWKVQRRMA